MNHVSNACWDPTERPPEPRGDPDSATLVSGSKVVCLTFRKRRLRLCAGRRRRRRRSAAGALKPCSSPPETHVVVTNALISDENDSPDWMSCFMVYFPLNGRIISGKSIRLHWRRLESRDYKLIRKRFSEVIHKVRSRLDAFRCRTSTITLFYLQENSTRK